ncbi:MAG: MBL fold metallo-hydrolase RNA specificity domain-containing protein [Acidobacteriota bacterium]
MQIQFIGATHSVTGSMHMVHINGKKILLDCGMFQGRRAEAAERNKSFPFDASTISAVVLSHAHIDHSGNLPNLVKQGFRGPIYATSATADLCRIMLTDSAFIQKKDAQFITKKHAKKHMPPVEPLYTVEDVDAALELFQGLPYDTEFEVTDGARARFVDAGHILGSASVVLTLDDPSSRKETTLGFTGDLGRPNLPVLRDPQFMGDVDTLISESTYGGRYHVHADEMKSRFLEIVRRTVDRRGKIIIPAFSVGRTQDIVYKLNELKNNGSLPDIPVYVDSPLSVKATGIFKRHPECFDAETVELLKTDPDPFGFDRLTYIQDVEESKKLNDTTEPCMIIAASGMCEAGRIVHHLANNIGDAKNTVMIVGYQAEHTLGRRLVEHDPIVKIFGEEYAVKCDVEVMNSFSAHADRTELMDYFEHFDRSRLKNIYLVHGEEDQSQKFAAGLKEKGFRNVDIPVRMEKAEL